MHDEIDPIPSSDITPPDIYRDRRRFLKMAAGLPMAAAFPEAASARPLRVSAHHAYGVPRQELTSFQEVTTWNNFYEFGLGRRTPSQLAGQLITRPWTVWVDGEVHKPRLFDIDQLIKLAPLEDRIYRLRCVEGWSMVIPWVGYPLAKLLKRVRPTGKAKFVEFTTLYRPEQLPGQAAVGLDWPYVEGLRLDEALHPLTLLAFGLYGQTLPNQNGAPLRLVVPWKYGFKSAKTLVRIRLVETQPMPTWVRARPEAYGFYSNVNPTIAVPWSQATEYFLSDFSIRQTRLFNGYAKQVAHLYRGMDLTQYF